MVNQERYPAGEVCNYPVNGTDLISTFHSLGNVSSLAKLDGRDLTTLFTNPKIENWQSDAMIQTYTGSLYGDEVIADELNKAWKSEDWDKFICDKKTGTRSWLMLRQGKYKYIRYIWKDYIEELYDLENDPDELQNLAIKKDFHKLLGEMRIKTEEEFKSKGASFIDLIPEPKVVDLD